MKLLLGTLIFALTTLGCGGSDAGLPLSEAEYTAQGNAICQRMNADLDALSVRASAGVSPQEEREIFDQANQLSRDAIDALFELAPPASLVEARQSLLALVEERRGLIERLNTGEDRLDDLTRVNTQFEDEAGAIWPSCTP